MYRQHSTSKMERVDVSTRVLNRVAEVHGLFQEPIAQAVAWARSPRKTTSPQGIDRGVYEYRIYEYITVDGVPEQTGRWVIVRFVVEWGDGERGAGELVTAFPVETQNGAPKKVNNKSQTPTRLKNSIPFGPPNNDILY